MAQSRSFKPSWITTLCIGQGCLDTGGQNGASDKHRTSSHLPEQDVPRNGVLYLWIVQQAGQNGNGN
jgi:hypothetical protein